MRVVGMDIHRSFAQVAILEEGQIIQELRIDLVYGPLVNFAKTLSPEDEVVIEATGNSAAVERLMRLHAKRIAGANSRLFRAIAYARSKRTRSMPRSWRACGVPPKRGPRNSMPSNNAAERALRGIALGRNRDCSKVLTARLARRRHV
jgi:hypothetical protein